MGISRIAVFKKIKSGAIKARKIGRNFAIHKNDLPDILGKTLTEEKKNAIEAAVKKAVKEYRQVFERLAAYDRN